MKNTKFLTIAAVAGLTLGGISVSTAAAQSYGGETSSPTAETADPSVEADTGDIVLTQEADDGIDADERRSGRRGGCDLDAAAAAIGIDETDLGASIEEGSTIADAATANGVAVDVVIDAMLEAKVERIGDKVAEGRLTQDEADEKLAELETRISNRVNGVEEDSQV